VTKIDTSGANNDKFTRVTIQGFSAIAASTDIDIHIAGIKTSNKTAANATLSASVYAYKVKNRERTELARELRGLLQATASSTFTSSGTTVYSDSVVSKSTSITITLLNSDTALTQNGYLIISFTTSHEKGYCAGNPSITCETDNDAAGSPTAASFCYCYDEANMILVQTANVAAAALTNAATNRLVINGAVNPGSVGGSVDVMQIVLSDTAYAHEKVLTSINMAA
jgi:hypothetical protein